MSVPNRIAHHMRSISATPFRTLTSTSAYRKDQAWPQRTPIGAYYETILNKPSPYPFDQKPEDPPNSADPEVPPEDKKLTCNKTSTPSAKKRPGRKPKASATATVTTASTTPSRQSDPTQIPLTGAEKARIVFGTRLAGPEDKASHVALKKSQSAHIAGVLVPPEPTEPDNCCMSGCVNCVWELYREDMEEYTVKRTEAQRRLASGGTVGSDGGGSQPDWQSEGGLARDLWDEKLFANVPVGIREFMKVDKRLKEQHESEGTGKT